MKTTYFILLSVIIFAACNSNNNTSDAYGTFEATEIIVSAESMGKIMELSINEGSTYKANTIIGHIDTTDLWLKYKQLQAQREAIAAKVQNIISQRDVQKQQKDNLFIEKTRIENLLKNNAATQKQLDDINGNINSIDKQIAAIESQNAGVFSEIKAMDAQIAQIKESIKKCHIKIPVDGTILTKYAQCHEFVTPGKPLFKIANITEMELKIFISGTQLPHINIGDTVQVLIDKDAKTNSLYKGVVSWIASSAEFTPKIIQTKDERVNLVYAVKIRVKNDGAIKIGMPGEAMFIKKS